MCFSAELICGISPLLIALFAFEMSALEVEYNDGRVMKMAMTVRSAFYMTKLPLSLLIPAMFGNIGGVAVGIVDAVSVWHLIREARR